MKINTLLERIGLTHPTNEIYLALLSLGTATISDIAKHTGFYRPLVYKNIALLIERSIVSRTRIGKRTYYIAEKPTVLASAIDDLKIELETAMPELVQTYANARQRPVIRFFEGRKGILHVYEEMMLQVKKGDAVYRYESPKDYKKNGRYYPSLYWKEATGPNGKIEKYVITNEKTHTLRSPRLTRHSKHIPASFDLFDYDITQLVYADKVVFIDYETETASVIENRRFAEFQKKIFTLLFKKLT